MANFMGGYLSSCTQCSNQDMLAIRTQVIETICTHPLAPNTLFLTFMLRAICHAISLGYNVNQCLVAWMPCPTAADLIERMLFLFESGMIRKNSLGTSKANRLGSLLGDSLSLLFTARHGLHEKELFELLGRVREQSRWNSQTKGKSAAREKGIKNYQIANSCRMARRIRYGCAREAEDLEDAD